VDIGYKDILTFFLRNIFCNFLALFLIALSIADGEEAVHEIAHVGIHLSEVDHDYVDFPTSLTRKTKNNGAGSDRGALIPFYEVEFSQKQLDIFSTALLRRFQLVHLHPLMVHWIKLVICKNAP
jgi:hypothetical protein